MASLHESVNWSLNRWMPTTSLLILVFVLTWSQSIALAAPTDDGGFLVTFDNLPLGPYAERDIRKDWAWNSDPIDVNGDGDVDQWGDLDQTEISHMDIVEYTDKHGQSRVCLRIGVDSSFPGIYWDPPIPEQDAYFFEFKVLFAPNSLNYSKNKFMGMVAGRYHACGSFDPSTGGSVATQLYRSDTHVIFKEYAYHRDNSFFCGEENDSWYDSPLNEWTTIRIHWKLNNGDNYDGFYKVWVNEVLRHEQNEMRWRTSDSTYQIDNLYFHPMAHQSTPTELTYMYFDDFKIWPANISPPGDDPPPDEDPPPGDDPPTDNTPSASGGSGCFIRLLSFHN